MHKIFWEGTQEKLNNSKYHPTTKKVYCVSFFEAVSGREFLQLVSARGSERGGEVGGVCRLLGSCTSSVHFRHHWRSFLAAVKPSLRWSAALTFPAGWRKPEILSSTFPSASLVPRFLCLLLRVSSWKWQHLVARGLVANPTVLLPTQCIFYWEAE